MPSTQREYDDNVRAGGWFFGFLFGVAFSLLVYYAVTTAKAEEKQPPTIIERVIQVKPRTAIIMIEDAKILQTMPLAAGRYRIQIKIKPEKELQ